MGKRSNFARKELDTYDTPNAAVAPLLPHLPPKTRFIDPCAGAGDLVEHLLDAGHVFNAGYDLQPRADYIRQCNLLAADRRTFKTKDLDAFITNLPWERKLLHPMIAHLRSFDRPLWTLIDANWMFTAQAEPFLRYCSKIVTVGRVRWIPGSTMTGKDDCAWFLFEPEPVMFTQFIGKTRQHDG
jgi:hypothetical protein